jgi:hypothetical protein
VRRGHDARDALQAVAQADFADRDGALDRHGGSSSGRLVDARVRGSVRNSTNVSSSTRLAKISARSS